MALTIMAHRGAILLLAFTLAAPMAAGCMVHSHGRPAHASAGPGPRHVPPGQIRRAEVHERNDARKAQRAQGNDRGKRR